MVSFHILTLWKKKIVTQIFGILRSVTEGIQTYFFRPYLDGIWIVHLFGLHEGQQNFFSEIQIKSSSISRFHAYFSPFIM